MFNLKAGGPADNPAAKSEVALLSNQQPFCTRFP